MTVTFEIPIELEKQLRQEFPDLNQAAKEAALVEMYRREKITRPELSRALGLGRIETDGLLKRHNVTEDLPTLEEYEESVARFNELLKK
jgi:hypothetical protein